MQSTYDILVNQLADLEEENRELREQLGDLEMREVDWHMLRLERDQEWNELNAEVKRLEAIIDEVEYDGEYGCIPLDPDDPNHDVLSAPVGWYKRANPS